jgi:hypothetical protein
MILNLRYYLREHTVEELIEWLSEHVGPAIRVPSLEGEIKNSFSHEYIATGHGWKYRFLVTINKQDQYPEEWASSYWHEVRYCPGEEVYQYRVLEIEDDSLAIMFKLKFNV